MKSAVPGPQPVPGDRLDSWKEIGNYLNRDVRTVQRWERAKGLPVRRLPGGDMARVYALKSELDTWWSSRGLEAEEAHKSGSVPSIAVLPFLNLSDEKENEYFGDGLADDIIDALAKLPRLRVIARTSAFAFRGKKADLPEIRSKLGVDTVLEGSVRRSGTRLRVSAQLINTEDQSHIWSERYDREMTDVFEIQDDISRAIVDKLRVRLVSGHPLVKQHTQNLEAYNLFLQGRYWILRVTPESLAKGKEYLERAIALQPDYALPHTAVAEYYSASALWGFVPGIKAIPQLKRAASRALELDDTLAEAHAQLGVALCAGEFEWEAGEREFRRAQELNPATPTVHYYYGLHCLRPMGRIQEELPVAQLAVDLDPLSARYNANLGYVYDLNGQYELSVAQHRRAIELDPSIFMPHFFLSVSLAHRGDFDDALNESQIACDLSRRNSRALGGLAWISGIAGDRDRALRLLDELIARSQSGYVPPFAMAAACSGAGDVEQMLEWLDKGIEVRDLQVVSVMSVEPAFAEYGNPRFRALLRKMKLDCAR